MRTGWRTTCARSASRLTSPSPSASTARPRLSSRSWPCSRRGGLPAARPRLHGAPTQLHPRRRVLAAHPDARAAARPPPGARGAALLPRLRLPAARRLPGHRPAGHGPRRQTHLPHLHVGLDRSVEGRRGQPPRRTPPADRRHSRPLRPRAWGAWWAGGCGWRGATAAAAGSGRRRCGGWRRSSRGNCGR